MNDLSGGMTAMTTMMTRQMEAFMAPWQSMMGQSMMGQGFVGQDLADRAAQATQAVATAAAVPTLRDHFAIQALQALLDHDDWARDWEGAVERAYAIADKMMTVRAGR